jgi:hypothetical protein
MKKNCNRFIHYVLFLCIIQICESRAQQASISTSREAPIGVVTFGPAVTSGVLGNGNFIDGYVKKSGTGTFTFPVGDNGVYRPFAASGETLGAYFLANPSVAVTSNPQGGNYGVLPAGGPFNTASLDQGIAAVSKKEYWDINGSTSTRITLTWNTASDIPVLVNNRGISKVIIAGWDGAKWVQIPSAVDITALTGGNSSLSSGSITTVSAIVPNTYNVYTLGAAADGALPVTLVSFTAKEREKTGFLEWVTSSEINSSHFDIQRSGDGKSWITLGKVLVKNENSLQRKYDFSDLKPFGGINFYRLKMVDKDDTFTYSHISKLNFDLNTEIAIYPNPASNQLYFSGVNSKTFKELVLTDLNGRSVYASRTLLPDGLDVSKIPHGLYLLNLSFKDGTSKSYKVVISR